MADTKISALTAAGALAGTESVPVVQGGATKRTTASAIAALSVSSGLLSYKEYNPGSLGTYTTTSSTLVDMDATNLTLPSFTSPASGFVIVTLSGLVVHGAADIVFGIRDGSGDVAGSEINVFGGSLQTDRYSRMTARRRIAVTPSTTISGWKWAWRRSSTGTATMYVGSASNAVAVMEVWAA